MKVSQRIATHPLVGAWRQKPNRFHTTPVVYKITAKNGKFGVSGEDTEDETPLKISQIKWDGESLLFKSLYPPTKHEATHTLKILPEDKMRHEIRYTSEGESYSDREVWIRDRKSQRLHTRRKSG